MMNRPPLPTAKRLGSTWFYHSDHQFTSEHDRSLVRIECVYRDPRPHRYKVVVLGAGWEFGASDKNLHRATDGQVLEWVENPAIEAFR